MGARTVLAVFLATALAAGCEASRRGTPAGPAGEARRAAEETAPSAVVELRFDQVIAHGALELEWLEVGDSRCPRGVTCFWEGQAIVTVEVTRAPGQPVAIDLVLRPGSEPRPVEAAGHRFELLEVVPHPREGVTPRRSERVARVRVDPA